MKPLTLTDYSVGELSSWFLSHNLRHYWDVVQYVNQIPYGRNTNRACYQLVLTEQRGTCSTKHGLVAALAKEQGVALQLHVGLFEMNEENTPAVAPVLDRYGLDAILEAHCYLSYQNLRFDITFPNHMVCPIPHQLLDEVSITPEAIGEDKVSFHQKNMRAWADKAAIAYPFDALWCIREECIRQLSLPGCY